MFVHAQVVESWYVSFSAGYGNCADTGYSEWHCIQHTRHVGAAVGTTGSIRLVSSPIHCQL